MSTITSMKGTSLIEVLVTMVILAIGLLGLAGLQLSNMKNGQNAYYRSQATFLTHDIIDRMRVNRAAAADYAVAVGTTSASGSNTVAVADIAAWKTTLSNDLPEGEGSVAVNGNLATICVVWDDRRGSLNSDPCFAAGTNPVVPACATGGNPPDRKACFRTQAGI